jgi:protein involved in polysaccharide export with SLBB domain
MRLERLVGAGLLIFATCGLAAAEEGGGRAAEERVYMIAPGDTVGIFVAERPDLSTQVRIPLEGRIIIPGAGAIRAAGRGVEELSLEIARLLEVEARLVKPRVAVSVVAYGSRLAFVYGAVMKAQAVALPSERPLTLTQVVAASGGFRPDADRERVRITRRSAKGAPRVFEVDAQKTAEGASPETDPVLEPGDTVYVPMREPVYVLGQVKNAGAHPVPYGYPLTVSKVIALSGGLDKFARYTRVVVMRRSAKGTEIFSVNLAAVFEGKLDEDMELKAGDTIFIPERRF